MVEHVHIHIVCIGTIFDNESVVSDDIEWTDPIFQTEEQIAVINIIVNPAFYRVKNMYWISLSFLQYMKILIKKDPVNKNV